MKKLGADVKVGIEICREAAFSALKEEASVTSEPMPDIHFLISASAKMNLDKIFGNYFIHADSRFAPMLILTKDPKEYKSDVQVQLFCHNLLQDDNDIEMTPVNPIYPFRFRIIDQLDFAINQLQDPSIQNSILLIKDKILNEVDPDNIYLTNETLEFYENIFKQLCLIANKYPQEQKSTIVSFHHSFLKPLPLFNLLKWATGLSAILEDQD